MTILEHQIKVYSHYLATILSLKHDFAIRNGNFWLGDSWKGGIHREEHPLKFHYLWKNTRLFNFEQFINNSIYKEWSWKFKDEIFKT